MKYYKLNSDVYAFELDGSQDDFIKDEMILMTDEEVEAHKAPKPTERTADFVKSEILDLEQRAIRPLLAGESNRVAEIKAQIEALRQELNNTQPKGD